MQTEKIIEALKELGAALAPKAQQGWEIMVQGHFYGGLFQTIGAGSASLALIIFIAVCFWFIKKGKGEGAGDFIFFASLFLLFSLAVTFSGIYKMCAPEYHALKELLR